MNSQGREGRKGQEVASRASRSFQRRRLGLAKSSEKGLNIFAKDPLRPDLDRLSRGSEVENPHPSMGLVVSRCDPAALNKPAKAAFLVRSNEQKNKVVTFQPLCNRHPSVGQGERTPGGRDGESLLLPVQSSHAAAAQASRQVLWANAT